MNKTPQFDQQTEPVLKSEVKERYLSILEAIPKSRQTKEFHETMKLLNEELTINDSSAEAFIYKPR